jgi:DNA-binding NtrC family response regulator
LATLGQSTKDEVSEPTEIGKKTPTEEQRPELHLVVMGQGVFAKYPLAGRSEVTIGRSNKSDVRLSDPLASRNHALLHVADDRIRVEDLDSANGTRVRGAKLAPGKSKKIGVGEPIAIGSTILMVQQMWAFGRPKRLWPHGYFEARLEEECARAERADSKFAVVRLHVEGANGKPPANVIAEELRSSDVLATYGPSDYEILLVDSPRQVAVTIVQRIVDRLAGEGIRTQSGIACYPDDARAPDAIIARACALVRGTEVAGTPLVLYNDSMRRVYDFATRMAQGTISVLILGETGVGKEVLAETIHRLSPRSARPFVRLNCAAFTDSLVESELFGHERGAFTGAAQAKPGLLETADGGTVFLDEVGELPASLQVKLLRVLETREVVRVGGLKPQKIDVRFIAATNRDLEAEVLAGTFRQDLYFRLNGATVVIPALRERLSELTSLADSFVLQICQQLGRTSPAISPDARAILGKYSWPGNIRELKNVIERAVLLCSGEEIRAHHLPIEKMGEVLPRNRVSSRVPTPPKNAAASDSSAPRTDPSPTNGAPERVTSPPDKLGAQRTVILDALAKCAGNQTRAAKLLGISRRTLVSRLDALGVARPRK